MSVPNHEIWKSHLQGNEFRKQAIASIILLTILLITYTQFILNIEKRQGIVLPDPILSIIPAYDVSWIVFTMLYSCLILAIYQLMSKPLLLLLGVQTFLVMYVFRTVAIYLAPLDPPMNYVPLKDPFIQFLIHTNDILSRDLFFSGHTAVMMLLFLFAPTRNFRRYVGLCTLILMAGLAVQHVHYSIDIFIAPLATYSSYKLVLKYQMASGILREMQETDIRNLGLVF